ncbi:hypothetical protein Ahy_A04g017571 isoform A [Arachis hypogaea]|uniref:Uncharacterized protein n=1 Tax=Arachis hypogaea TaxID=3818 RepID=A0A445DBH5_ARAHY|nr:hypothetical protein Ahy_A04g017571 isoform A [Arachis hypogaea]
MKNKISMIINLNFAGQERVSKEDSKKTVSSVDSRSKKETKKPVNQEFFELPQNFKNLISEMGGSRITLVIEKILYDSDLNSQQNRLLIPSQQAKNSGFVPPTKLESLEEKMEIIHRAKLHCQWFQCRLRSSSSDKNKLKEPLVDSNDSTVPFSSKKKAANAFGYCLESEGTSCGMREETNKEEKRMMNIKRGKRDFKQHCEFKPPVLTKNGFQRRIPRRPLAQWILGLSKKQKNQSTKNHLNCHKILRT